MSDDQIQDGLEAIAQESVPENLDLWPEIHAQLTAARPAHRSMSRTVIGRLARLAAAVVLLVIVSTGAYAVVERILLADPTFQQLSDADLVTIIDQQQTHAGITTTLDWAYADENRLAIAYSTQYNRAEIDYPAGGITITETLITADGQVIPPAFGGGGGGGGGGGATIRISQANANYDPGSVLDGSGTLNLQLSLTYQAAALSPGPMSIPPIQDDGPTIPPEDFEPLTVTFDFSLPVYLAYRAQPQETVTVNDVSITLDSVEITPSLTQVTYCIQPASVDEVYQSDLFLETETTQTTTFGSLQRESNCHTASFSLPVLPDATDSLTFSVRHLRHPFADTEANAQRIIAGMAEIGVQFDVVGERTGDLTYQFPGGFQLEENDETALRHLADLYASLSDKTISGPWTFEIDLP